MKPKTDVFASPRWRFGVHGGGGKGGGGSTTVTEKADPWIGVQGPLQRLYHDAENLPVTQFYPGNTVAPFTPETMGALGAIANRAIQGSPLNERSKAYFNSVAGGGALGGGPVYNRLEPIAQGHYLYGGGAHDAYMNAARRRVVPAVDSMFSQGGRYGSGSHQALLARELSDSYAGLYNQERNRQQNALGAMGNIYEAERGRQQAAAGALPDLANIDYSEYARLGGVGAAKEAQTQAKLDEFQQRWDYNQQSPYHHMTNRSSVIQGGIPGGLGSRTEGPGVQTNPFANVLGAGALGLEAYNSGLFGGLGGGAGAALGIGGLAGLGAGIAAPASLAGITRNPIFNLML